MITNRTEEQVEELRARCLESERRDTSEYPGMTYEQGILAALDWLCDDQEYPFD